MWRLKSWKNVPGRFGVKNEMRFPMPARIAMLVALSALAACAKEPWEKSTRG